MNELKSKRIKEYRIKASLSHFSYWIRNQLLGIQHDQAWKRFGNDQFKVLLTSFQASSNEKLSEISFYITLKWGKGKVKNENDGSEVIQIIGKEEDEFILIRAEYQNEVVDDFLTNLFIDLGVAHPSKPSEPDEKPGASDVAEKVDPEPDCRSGAQNTDIEPSPRKSITSYRDEILRMWQEHNTADEIAGQLGFHSGSIRNYISNLRKIYGTEKVPYHS